MVVLEVSCGFMDLEKTILKTVSNVYHTLAIISLFFSGIVSLIKIYFTNNMTCVIILTNDHIIIIIISRLITGWEESYV